MWNNNSLRDWQTASSVCPKRRVNHWVNFVCTAKVWSREGNPKKKTGSSPFSQHGSTMARGQTFICAEKGTKCASHERRNEKKEKKLRRGGGKEFGSCKCRFLLQKSHICNLSCSLLKEKTLQGLWDLKETMFPRDEDLPTFFLCNDSTNFCISSLKLSSLD